MIPSSSDTDHTVPIIAGSVALFGAGLLAAWVLKQRPKQTPGGPPAPDPFSNEKITETFIAALPTITRELNLEIATTHQTEVFERKDSKSVFWGLVDLGSNIALLLVPVTYRYHLRLYDRWKLSVSGSRLVVEAPVIRASMPPAIHTDGMTQFACRGWGRGSPQKLITQLQHDITPTLCHYAADPNRINAVRETCRHAVAAFVRRWLEGHSQWRLDRFSSVQVRFPDEQELPPAPTLKLLS